MKTKCWFKETGECCCKCYYQVSLHKHPSNNGQYKGHITEPTGLYACLLFGGSQAIITDRKHSVGCECFDAKQRPEYPHGC